MFFAVGTLLIALPTGLKVFNWTATMWGGSIRLTTAMMFAVAFPARVCDWWFDGRDVRRRTDRLAVD